MSTGVIYLVHGTSYLCRLVVSLYTLRRHYAGPVLLLETGADRGLLANIVFDERLSLGPDPNRSGHSHIITTRIDGPPAGWKHCYSLKSTLWRHSPFDTSLLIDADTLITADLDILFTTAASNLTLTKHGDWTTATPTLRERLESWRDIAPTDVDVALDRSRILPAVNTGVVGWSKNPVVESLLEEWEYLSTVGRDRFIADEIAMQLVLANNTNPAGGIKVVGDQWNCSPLFGVNCSTARIWHFHGRKHVLRANGRGEAGHQVWWPAWEECWRGNVGGVRDWAPAGDRHLGARMKANDLAATS